MRVVKYVGEGRYGTIEPKRIWTPGETKEVSNETAKELLKDPYFIEVKPKQKVSKTVKEKANPTQQKK